MDLADALYAVTVSTLLGGNIPLVQQTPGHVQPCPFLPTNELRALLMYCNARQFAGVPLGAVIRMCVPRQRGAHLPLGIPSRNKEAFLSKASLLGQRIQRGLGALNAFLTNPGNGTSSSYPCSRRIDLRIRRAVTCGRAENCPRARPARSISRGGKPPPSPPSFRSRIHASPPLHPVARR